MSLQASVTVHALSLLESSSLIVAWRDDAGKLGSRTTEYVRRKLACEALVDIEPDHFFPLDGVSIDNDISVFPETRFYQCPNKLFSLLTSDMPAFEWHEFLQLVLDVAQHHCKAKEIYTVGGMITLTAHTSPRQIVAVANSPEMKRVLAQFDVVSELEHQTMPGQRPTMSSYLLWMARKRNIPAASLWVPMPFYLTSNEDPRAWKRILSFLNTRFDLGIDLRDIDEAQMAQDSKIAELLKRMPELEEYVRKLESNLALTQEESEKLAKGMREGLREKH